MLLNVVKALFAVGIILSLATPGFSETVRFKATSDYKGKAVSLRGEYSKPAGKGPFPAVLLMHGCSGLESSVLKSLRVHARSLNRNGFATLIVDSMGPRRIGFGWVCKTDSRLTEFLNYRIVDAFDSMKFLREDSQIDDDNIFLMGQSHGGNVALIASRNIGPIYGSQVFGKPTPTFRAAVAYYPWCGIETVGPDSSIRLLNPVLVFGGGRDDWTPPAGCKRLEDPEDGLEVIIYPKAAHSFDENIRLKRYLGYLVGYNRQATVDSRNRMVEFFQEHLTDEMKARTPLSITKVQQLLKDQGYDPGPIDGAWGSKTLSALNSLRENKGLKPVTELDQSSQDLLKSLN